MCISELLRALCARKIHNYYDDMNYSKLIAAIDDRIRANGRREITGQTLHDVLEAMVRSLGAGYQVAGVLGPDDDPGEPDQRFAWLASEAGVYRHCGGVSVTELSWLVWGGGQWLVKPLDVPFGASVREWITDAVAEERSRALIAEALLQKNIDKEVADRTEAVADEAAAREAADTALGKRIDAETSERKAADTALGARIDTETQERKDADAEEKAAREKAVAAEAKARADADTALGERVDTETADRKAAVAAEETARKSADAALDGRVTAVESKIPAQASAENQLADKAFVNSSISTATATFRGTFESLEALKAAEADKNDYAFWVHKDEAGNTCYDKYAYDGAEWRFKYRLNNSSFTAAQWAALNSGVTADVIAALQAADKATAAAVAQETADRKEGDKANADAVGAEKTRAQAAEKANADAIAKEAAALEKGAEVSVKIQNADAEFASPTSVLRVVGYSYTAPDGPLLLHAVSPRYDAAADVQTNFNSVVFKWKGGGNVALYRFTPQAALVSGTNIKTVNGESLLGSGDLSVSGGLPTIKAGGGLYSEIFNSGTTPLEQTASGEGCHIEGAAIEALGDYSHAEGLETKARGRGTHAEGWGSLAKGSYSHAEGFQAYTYGDYSHAEGKNTIVYSTAGHAEGKCNTGQSDSIHEVGIGTSTTARKDAHRITKDGKHYIPGVGNFTGVETTAQIASGGIKDLATVISELESAGGGGGPFALAFTLGTGDKWSMDCTFAELAAAVDAKRGVIFTVNNGSYDGDVFTATLLMHSSAANVVVLQGYVNKAYIYVVVTNGSTGLTVDVSEVNLVDIDTVIPVAPSNENVPGTKAIKDYVDDKWAPCHINIGQFPADGGVAGFNVISGELSPDRVIALAGISNSNVVPLNAFGLRGDPNNRKTYYGCVLSSTGTVVKVTFDLDAKTVTFNGGDI